jgi:hypothetical protein
MLRPSTALPQQQRHPALKPSPPRNVVARVASASEPKRRGGRGGKAETKDALVLLKKVGRTLEAMANIKVLILSILYMRLLVVWSER